MIKVFMGYFIDHQSTLSENIISLREVKLIFSNTTCYDEKNDMQCGGKGILAKQAVP